MPTLGKHRQPTDIVSPGEARRASLAGWAPVAILVLAAVLRLVALDAVPPGLQHDEVFSTTLLAELRAGQLPIFFDANGGNEPFFGYLTAATITLFGANFVALRLPAVAAGLIAIALTYRLGRHLWGRQVALLAMLVLTLCLWHVLDSRVSLRAIWLPAFLAAGYYCLWRGAPGRAWGWVALGALMLAAALYTYTSAALGVATAAVFGAVQLTRRETRGTGLIWLGAVAVAALASVPMFLHWAQVPDAGLRVRDLSYELAAAKAGDLGPILRSALRVAGMFAFVGDPEWRYNVAGRPAFTLLVGLATYCGLALCLWRAREPRYQLMLFWTILNLGASAVTSGAPSFLRALGAALGAALAAAVGLAWVWGWLAARGWRAMGTALVAAALLLEGMSSAWAYFAVWPRHPEVREIYRADLAEVARYLGRAQADGPVVVSAEFAADLDRLSFEYLGFTAVQPRYFDGGTSLLLPGEGGLVIETGTRPLAGNLRAVVQGVGQMETQGSGFTTWRVTADGTESGDALAEVLAPWPGPALSITDVTWAEGARGGALMPVTVSMRVTAQAPGGRGVMAYARVVDGTGYVWVQADALLVPTSDWRVGDRFYQVMAPLLPADMPGSKAWVEVGLYEDPAQPYPLLIGPERLPFNRLSLGPVMVAEGPGALAEGADLDVRVDGGVVTAATWAGDTVTPGQAVRVILQGTGLSSADLSGTRLDLRPADGEAESVLLANLPGPIHRYPLLLRVPREAAGGEYQAQLLLPDTEATVPLGPVTVTEPIRVELPSDGVARLVTLEGGIELWAGVEPPARVQQGSALSLDLWWVAGDVTDVDYTVFVHLRDGQGAVVSGADGAPGGDRPTPGWLPGEVIHDLRELPVPPGLAPGRYEVAVGLYEANRPGYPRLRVLNASGTAGEDWAQVATIEVSE